MSEIPARSERRFRIKDEQTRVRCPECAKTVGVKAKGKVEVSCKRSKTKYFECEIVVGAIICPYCRYRLSIPVSALEAPRIKPTEEAHDARGI